VHEKNVLKSKIQDCGGFMKQRWLLLIGITVVLLLTGCQEKKETSSETKPESGCRFGVCIQQVYATMDGENFIVFFDLTPKGGLLKLDAAPMFTNTVQVSIKNDSGKVYQDKSYTPEEYYCYAGTDIPWADGKKTATCGIGGAITADMEVPALGEELIVSLPEFGNFETRVTVISGW
jgi:hypothetical protein